MRVEESINAVTENKKLQKERKKLRRKFILTWDDISHGHSSYRPRTALCELYYRSFLRDGPIIYYRKSIGICSN